jgi:hypothetical protein
MGKAIIKSKLLQSPFLLSAIPPYTGQCLYTGSASYRYEYVVYVMPLCYKMYQLLKLKFLKILKYSNWS